jgi:class 3 adenylate cyclase/tetratricopeptide (TPR) repeat protein
MGSVEVSQASLRPYVPRLLADWRPSAGDPRHMRVEGSLVFVDISGFTKLTERLARKGTVGAEEMSDLLSATFSALLLDARAQDADLLKWGGDAVLLLFRGEDHAGRACRAAYDMRTTLRTVGTVHAGGGTVTLRMSVGIHSDSFDLYLVGDPAHHRELFVVGPPASATAVMESVATAGQVVISDATAGLLPAAAHRPRAGEGGGHLLRTRPRVPPGDLPRQRRQGWDGASDDALGRFVPTDLRRHLLSEVGEAEHRSVAVAFVRITGTDALTSDRGTLAVADALDDRVRIVQELCAEHEVTFFETDIDRDGAKIMLVSGAPRSAGHDEERMLRTVRAVMDRSGVLPLRIGVNRGNVFAGDFGPEFRRTYSIKGDAVNLAARVMGKAADGEVLATSATLDRSGTGFETTPLEPFLVKGKALPVHAARVGRLTGRRSSDGVGTAFVGRRGELTALREALDNARAGAGREVVVVGEPGIGKSRLVQELLGQAPDVRVLRAVCGEYESSIAYHPFRALLRTAIGLPADADGSDAVDRLRETVGRVAPDLLVWLPLLAVPLDVEVPPTRESSELDEQFRRTRLEEVVDGLLHRLVRQPTVLLVEDAHHIDEASAGLVDRLARGAPQRQWCVVVTRRDVTTGYAPEARDGSTTVHVQPLDRDDATRLVRAATADRPMTNETMALLLSRSGGNPMFLEELVEAAARSGSVHDLPESVHDLLTSQIDRLDPLDRTVLRYAAVVGATVDRDVLRTLLRENRDGVDLDDRLPRLQGFLAPEEGGRLRFRRALMRDVAYEGLPFRRRRALHAQVGATIESSAASPDGVSEVLSLHYFHAGRFDRAWSYSRTAGHRARAKFAHGEAAEFFARAAESARRAADVPPHELAEVLERLGDARELAGHSTAAVEAFRHARSHTSGEPVREAELLFKEARIHQRRGKVPQSLRVLTRAMHCLDGRDTPAARSTRSRLASRYAFGRLTQGRTTDAMRWATLAARDAEDSADKATLAHAYNALHLAHLSSGEPEELPYGRLALLAYEELGDLAGQGHSANNLGLDALRAGEWSEAQGLFERAAGAFARVGDEANQANAAYNQADILVRQGRLAEAEPLLQDALRVARAVEDEELVGLSLREHGRVLSGSGRVEEALEELGDARARFTALGLDQELVAVDSAAAECHLLAGRDVEALSRVEAALARARGDHPDGLPAVHRVRGFVHLSAGRQAEADADFRAVLASSHGPDSRSETGFALFGLSLVTEDPAVREELRRESAAVLEPLGVAVTPSWPVRR